MTNPEHLADRVVLRISGADRKSFLQGVITQDMDALTPEAPIFAALLTPQGKILFDFIVYEVSEDLLLDCHCEAASTLIKRLSLYKLRAAVTIAQDDSLRVFSAPEPFSIDGEDAAPDPRCKELGWRLISSSHEASRETGTYEMRRLSCGVPEFGKDFDSDQVFLMDVNYDLLSGVSYQKGCFVGQEVASRMKRKGEARKRTLAINFDGAAPTKATPVTAGDSTLGEVLSASGNRALALIRLDRWEKAKAAGIMSVADDLEAPLSVPDYLKQD